MNEILDFLGYSLIKRMIFYEIDQLELSNELNISCDSCEIMINKLKREGMVYKSIISQKYYFNEFLRY